MNTKNNFILFAWKKNSAFGGFNDKCGDFTSPDAALEFFDKSTHCKNMDYAQIYDCKKNEIIWEVEYHG